MEKYVCGNNETREFIKDSYEDYDPVTAWSQFEYLQNFSKTNWSGETAELLQPYLNFATSDGKPVFTETRVGNDALFLIVSLAK